MTTFQAIVYAVVHGISEFLPIAPTAHHSAIAYFFDWPLPSPALYGALTLGSLLSVLIFFRHDWASIVSSFLQVLIYRKRPMTLDERLTFFLLITSLPAGASWYYLRDVLAQFEWTPPLLAASLAGFGILMWIADHFSRRNKGMFDWTSTDALVIGITQTGMLVPGCGRLTGAVIGGLFRNFNREAAAKYAFFASAPALAVTSFLHLQGITVGSQAHADISWLNFVLSVVITLFAGLLAIGGLMKHFQGRGRGQYAVYRLLLAGAIGAVFWLRTQ